MNENTPLSEAIKQLEEKIAKNEVKDAVHKIKFMTTRDVLKELIKSK